MQRVAVHSDLKMQSFFRMPLRECIEKLYFGPVVYMQEITRKSLKIKR